MAGGTAPEKRKGQPGLVQAALFGLCPYCGARTLFEAPAQIAGECTLCGEPLAPLERGGRLAGLITILVAALLVTAAFALDSWLRPPLWVHVLVWAPVTIGGVLMALRLFKTASIYRHFGISDR
jgi:uncharacterized protein (DUF983 family)